MVILVGCGKSWVDYACVDISEVAQKTSFSTNGENAVMGSSQFKQCEKRGNIITFVETIGTCQNHILSTEFDIVSGSLTYFFKSTLSGILVKQYQCEKSK